MAVNKAKKKILMVDDDEIQLMLAEAMLKHEYEFFTAKSGTEALEYFRHGLVPHLILLDVLMPQMDGWEIFNRIRGISLLKSVPIAFMTSVTGTAEQERAHEMGAVDYIMKPLEKKTLVRRIESIITCFESRVKEKLPG
jgi:putative two-component system response regulator